MFQALPPGGKRDIPAATYGRQSGSTLSKSSIAPPAASSTRRARPSTEVRIEPIVPVPCPGVRIEWDNFWETYPFQKHSPNANHRLDYQLISLDPIRVRSNGCLGSAPSTNGCSRCSDAMIDVNVLKERASRPFEKVHTEGDMTYSQLRNKLTATKEDVNAHKLKNLNLANSLTSTRERLSDFVEVFDFLGKNVVPALHRILTNAYDEGWGIKKLRKQLQLALEGKYFARKYTQYEIDLTILLYELGGAGAVHAMNHSIFVLPSLKTIQPYRRLHRITPSVGGLKFTEISCNISTLFGPHITFEDGTETAADPPTLCVHTLSFDELATERRIDYMTETDDMGGFCLEHLDALETTKIGKGIDTVEAAVAAVKEGKVHIAQEASVGAISHLSATNYGAKPVYIGPTCKKGTWHDCLRTMLTVVEAWKRSPDGEARHGPAGVVSSDGDPKRRLALFVMCMHSEILRGNPLYPYICNLDGLNRRVGFNNITADFDYKHDFKRICTSLCSPEGVVVKNVCINRDLLLRWLEKLPLNDWSETSIHALLNPGDGQNVERAVKLMLSIVNLRDLDSDEFNPTESAEFEALCVLGEVFDALLQPFINPNLSLSEQIESLVRFSHLICALYLQNGTSFLSNQLYGDLQAMVKNAVLLVPKTRIIDGRLGVYICLLGDDVLESLFGRCRMIGGHSPNCSVGELRDRFASAMNLDAVYEAHPELERKPRRLKLLRTRELDHLRPREWKGVVRADSCDLEICWVAGRRAAEIILQRYAIKMAISFTELFKRRNTDLMRPMGGKYPAISPGIDRSMANLSSDPSEIPSDVDPDKINPNNPLLYIDFDEMIARETAQSISEMDPHSVFAEIDSDGHLTHKKSTLRILFDMTHNSHGSHDRLQRVRGFTIGGKSWSHETPDDNSVTDATHFQLGSIFSTLICYNGTHLGFAVAKCTLIKKCVPGTKAVSISAIPLAELHLESSPYTISGQVFSLVPLNPTASEWAWDGQFISFSLKKNAKSVSKDVARITNLQFTVSSQIIDSIHKYAREILVPDDMECERERTWVFSNQHLLDSWQRLWARIIAEKSLHDKFSSKFTGVSNGVFPYNAMPSPDFVGVTYSLPLAGTCIQITNTDRQKCRMCNEHVKDKDRQTHIGHHILKSVLGVIEDDVESAVSTDYPCGTCGGPSTNESCHIQIKSGKAHSNCPSMYAFQIAAASKFSENRPCTNIPIRCTLGCDETHWKYNFPQHLQTRHPSWIQLISPPFLSQIQISQAEQRALGIPEAKMVDWLASDSRDQPRGEKRTSDWLQRSPSRRDKENQAPADRRLAKSIRLNYSSGPFHDANDQSVEIRSKSGASRFGKGGSSLRAFSVLSSSSRAPCFVAPSHFTVSVLSPSSRVLSFAFCLPHHVFYDSCPPPGREERPKVGDEWPGQDLVGML
ncbi:hypothetical protein B0H11DRAFT_2196011 [Mycena galericulata]|nr:hypothetical protein B0H11DRAFT_2196011 [Mycena galericulata]